jgi:hypothetical protein
MEKFRCTQKDRLHHYIPDRKVSLDQEFWFLIPFQNQWFNLIDIRKIKSEIEYLNPYEDLQIRWLYSEPPQKLAQSTYKATLDKVDFKLWVTEIIPNFENLTHACHCQHELQNETRCQGHLASGNLDNLSSNPIILDRLKRGPMFQETNDGDLNSARTALEAAL